MKYVFEYVGHFWGYLGILFSLGIVSTFFGIFGKLGIFGIFYSFGIVITFLALLVNWYFGQFGYFW